MQSAFGIVVVVVCAVGVVGAIVALALGRRSWEHYGSDLLVSDRDPSPAGSSSGDRDEEIRQLLAARNARRRRRGEPELDSERELARLAGAEAAPGTGAPRESPVVDDELRSEIRSLVIARNLRRARRGEPPLDVDAEVARQVADLSRL